MRVLLQKDFLCSFTSDYYLYQKSVHIITNCWTSHIHKMYNLRVFVGTLIKVAFVTLLAFPCSKLSKVLAEMAVVCHFYPANVAHGVTTWARHSVTALESPNKEKRRWLFNAVSMPVDNMSELLPLFCKTVCCILGRYEQRRSPFSFPQTFATLQLYPLLNPRLQSILLHALHACIRDRSEPAPHPFFGYQGIGTRERERARDKDEDNTRFVMFRGQAPFFLDERTSLPGIFYCGIGVWIWR